MTSCVIYCRFSPRRNASESESCETQEIQCREYAEAKGWEVRSVWADEGISGKEIERPGLCGALNALRRRDVLLVYRRCRIARGVLIAELTRRAVKKTGARIAAVHGDIAGSGDSPEDVFMLQILAAVHELERKLIGARTKAAMLTHQRGGRRMGLHAPYGTMVDPGDDKRLIPNPKEVAATERAAELIGEGMSGYEAAKVLDREMPKACRGNRWSPKTVKKIAGRASG